MRSVLFSLAVLSTTVCFASEPANSTGNIAHDAVTPESILPAGVDSTTSINPYTGESGPARKGTVAAILNNIALLNTLLSENMSPEDQIKAQEIIKAISSLIPSLRVIGVFDLFTPEEWLASDTQPGRVLAVVLYLQQYPKDIIPKIKQRLIRIKNQTKIKLLSDSIASALN
jgi:hypothetical protein